MTKKEIGEVLSIVRRKSGKSREELAELLGKTAKTIGHWETGYAQPDANMLFQLCSVCGTDVNTAFGFTSTSAAIDPAEQLLLTNYRDMNIEGQEKLSDYAEDLVASGHYKKHPASELGEKTA